jgi:hypothetical protein
MNAVWPARCQVFVVRREAGESWHLANLSSWLEWLRLREGLLDFWHVMVLVDLADGLKWSSQHKTTLRMQVIK